MLLSVLLLAAFPAFVQAQSTGKQALTGYLPEAVKRLHLQPLDRVSSSNRLHLAIGLPLRNQAALGQLLQQIYDPPARISRKY